MRSRKWARKIHKNTRRVPGHNLFPASAPSDGGFPVPPGSATTGAPGQEEAGQGSVPLPSATDAGWGETNGRTPVGSPSVSPSGADSVRPGWRQEADNGFAAILQP